MRPLTVVTGIVLGTCLSIAVSLAAVLLIFLVLGDDYPRLDYEFRALVTSLTVFIAMTAISSVSFYWLLVDHRWRFLAQGGLWVGILTTGAYFWP
jgi:hypothetical protein